MTADRNLINELNTAQFDDRIKDHFADLGTTQLLGDDVLPQPDGLPDGMKVVVVSTAVVVKLYVKIGGEHRRRMDFLVHPDGTWEHQAGGPVFDMDRIFSTGFLTVFLAGGYPDPDGAAALIALDGFLAHHTGEDFDPFTASAADLKRFKQEGLPHCTPAQRAAYPAALRSLYEAVAEQAAMAEHRMPEVGTLIEAGVDPHHPRLA